MDNERGSEYLLLFLLSGKKDGGGKLLDLTEKVKLGGRGRYKPEVFAATFNIHNLTFTKSLKDIH